MKNEKNTVLIVEDSASFALTLETAMRDCLDYDVLIARSFEELKSTFDSHRDEIFAAITDLTLPDAEDGAAVKMLTAYQIPCIAFTGNYSPELRDNMLALGVADYVLKKGLQDIEYVVDMVHRLKKNTEFKVLVVDDASSSQAYLQRVLEKQCFEVQAVGSGKAALEKLENGFDARIILIDLVMQEMDGFELLSEIRARSSCEHKAIIGVSGNASSEQIAKFMKYGGSDFLVKPFEHEQVVCRVNSNAQLLDQMDHLARLNQQKNDLLGMAAHDIRGPLGVVMSAASMLKREVITEQGSMLLKLLTEAAGTMEELLNGLLDISVIESSAISIKPERMNLALLVSRLVNEMRLMAEAKDQTLIFESPVDILWISADENRIREVLMNLISNAIKYSPKGGVVEVSLSHNQKKARVQIIDEGSGIPDDEQHLLFQPFAQISTTPTGEERSTGLGLAISERIISRHKGKISYHDNQGKGSIFEVVLPIGLG